MDYQEIKQKIKNCRNILVGIVPSPEAQVQQITIALMYKFMDDMDKEAQEKHDAPPMFFAGEFAKYSWSKLLSPQVGNQERLNLYAEAIEKMNENKGIPQLFRDIFKGAFLPYRNPESLGLFLKEINGFTYDNSENLGNAFEHLLSIMGSQGDAGMFRTPRHIIDFIVDTVDPQKNENICDPACGSAGFLISAYKHIMKANTKKKDGDLLSPEEKKKIIKNFVGYDISPDMVRLSKVNMYFHGFLDPIIFEYDTLSSEEKWDENFDVMLANPPFMSPRGGIRPHKRFSVQANRSEVLFVDYILEHLRPNGRAGIIVPEGVIFKSETAYKALRKMLVEDGLIAVVSLPAGVFNPYAGVKTSILLFDNGLAKKTKEILFLKIQNDGYNLGAQRRKHDKNDLPLALEIIKKYKSVLSECHSALDAESIKKEILKQVQDDKLWHLVVKEKIAESGDYNLSGDRYKKVIDFANQKWPMVELGTLTKLFADGNWIESKDQSKNGIRLIQTGNVGAGEYLDKSDKSRFISKKTFERLNCTEVFAGDILVSRLPDPVGRACIVPKLDDRMITAVDCTIVRFDERKINPKYFLYYSKSDKYFNELSQYLTGASRQRISRSNLAKVKILLPSIEIQKEIVEQIDKEQKQIEERNNQDKFSELKIREKVHNVWSGNEPESDLALAIFKVSYNFVGDANCVGGICGSGFFVDDKTLLTAHHSFNRKVFQPNFGYRHCQFWLISRNGFIPIKENIIFDYPEFETTVVKLRNKQTITEILRLSNNDPKEGEECLSVGYFASIENTQPLNVSLKWDHNKLEIVKVDLSNQFISREGTIRSIFIESKNYQDVKLKGKEIIEPSYGGVKGMSGGPLIRKKTGEVIGMMSYGFPKDVLEKEQVFAISVMELKKLLKLVEMKR